MHKFKKDGTTYDTYWKMSGSSADLDWYLALLNMSDETVFAQGIRVKDTGIDKDGKMWTADDYVTDYFNKISEAFLVIHHKCSHGRAIGVGELPGGTIQTFVIVHNYQSPPFSWCFL